MPALTKKLSYLILGQKGGQNRIQIIELLKERPYNLNQLADIMNLNYRTVKHHMDVLLKNELVSTSKTGGYGEVYFLTTEMEGNMDIFEDILKKFEKSKKLKDFTSSPKFFQNVMKQTNDAVIIINKDGQTFFWNKSAEKLYGYKEEEILDDTIQIFPTPDIQNEMIDKITKGKKVVALETQLRHKSGKLIDVNLTMDGIKDENDNLIGFSILSRDITKRKRAEESLMRSEERYAIAQRAANIGSWDWNILTGDLHWSDTIEPLFGFDKGEFGATYEAFLECVHPDDRQFVQDSVNACVKEGKDYAIEHRILWPDGTLRWVSEMGDVIRNKKGEAIRMLGVVRDITRRKHAEEVLLMERERLLSVLDNMPFMVCLLTPDYHVAFANRAFREKFGEAHGRHCYEYCFGKKKPCDFCETYKVLRTGKPHRWEVTGPNGATIIDVHDFPFTDVDGSPMILEVDVDITDRKQMEEAL